MLCHEDTLFPVFHGLYSVQTYLHGTLLDKLVLMAVQHVLSDFGVRLLHLLVGEPVVSGLELLVTVRLVEVAVEGLFVVVLLERGGEVGASVQVVDLGTSGALVGPLSESQLLQVLGDLLDSVLLRKVRHQFTRGFGKQAGVGCALHCVPVCH